MSANTWNSDALDLDAYFARIGYDGPATADEDVLAAIHRGHVTSIPFENLDVILGHGVSLNLDQVQDKLVRRCRGGYCYEHVSLLAAVLERLGFRFTALSARVTLGAQKVHPASHAVIVVELQSGRRLLCDVGFGRGPLEPLALRDENSVTADGWRYRLSLGRAGSDDDVFRPQLWTLWQAAEDPGGGEWVDRHTFTLNPQYPVDYSVGNHFVSTSSHSPFTARPFVQKFSTTQHHTLDGARLRTIGPDCAPRDERELPVNKVPQVLSDVFGISLDADDAQRLVDWYR